MLRLRPAFLDKGPECEAQHAISLSPMCRVMNRYCHWRLLVAAEIRPASATLASEAKTYGMSPEIVGRQPSDSLLALNQSFLSTFELKGVLRRKVIERGRLRRSGWLFSCSSS